MRSLRSLLCTMALGIVTLNVPGPALAAPGSPAATATSPKQRSPRGGRAGGYSAASVYRQIERAIDRPAVVAFYNRAVPNAWGGGVLVGRSKSGREGLVLTVAHNLPANPGREGYVAVRGQRFDVVDVVAANPAMDYALVRVAAPRPKLRQRIGTALSALLRGGTKPRPHLPEPTAIGALQPGEALYLNGFPSPQATRPEGRLRFGHDSGGPLQAVNTHPDSPAVPSTSASYSSGLGFSGAPVFSRRSHRLVALHHANNTEQGPEVSFAVPVKLILDDLAGKLRHKQIAHQHQPVVSDLLQRASAP